MVANLMAVSLAGMTNAASTATSSASSDTGIHKIKHIIIIMQENRSFDSYFGTFPGANGFPMANGQFTTCVPNPAAKTCDYPYHDPRAVLTTCTLHRGRSCARRRR
jgi:phospholipase C